MTQYEKQKQINTNLESSSIQRPLIPRRFSRERPANWWTGPARCFYPRIARLCHWLCSSRHSGCRSCPSCCSPNSWRSFLAQYSTRPYCFNTRLSYCSLALVPRVAIFREKQNSAEFGTSRNRRQFRRNSACFAEEKNLGIAFRTISRKRKTLFIPFRTISRKRNTLGIPFRTISRKRNTLGIPFRTIYRKRKTIGIPLRTISRRRKLLGIPFWIIFGC